MQRRSFGHTGLEVGILGFGGAEVGLQNIEQSTVSRIINAALDSGLNVIDTAECYGESEVLVGRAIDGRRHECLLFTKCGHAFGFGPDNWEPKLLRAGIERSLRHLGTDRLDLVQLHTCTEDILRRGDVIEALQKARDAGKTRFIGYSGDGGAALYAVQCGAFDALQTSINIADQEAITLTLPQARQNGMGVIAKRPLANAVWRRPERPEYAEGDYWDRLQAVGYEFLQTEDVRAQLSTALRFTLGQPGVHTAIVGTTNPQHWSENFNFIEAPPLSDEELQSIRQAWLQEATSDWVGLG